MKATFILAAVAAATTVSAYQCPSTDAVNQSCRSINVSPLICTNPNVNVDQCNAKQCTQTYIDNYSACQCVRSATQFYEHSVNVGGLIRRCGIAGLTNPYGNPFQYRPGQGTQTFSPSSSGGIGGVATNIFDGTTYYGGSTAVVSGTTRIVSATAIVGGTTILPGTTTWVSGTPGIIRGTSTRVSGATAAPITSPTGSPIVTTQGRRISGGAIAGIVLGCLGAVAVAGLLGWCWRRKRAEHTTVYNSSNSNYDNRGPTRTVVTEKIEPVVVKSVPTGAATTSYNAANPAVNSSSVPAANTYQTTTSAPAVGVNTAGVHNPTSTTTTYNTTPTTGYNTQSRVVPGVHDSTVNGIHGATANVNSGTVGSGHINAASTGSNAAHNFSSSGNNNIH